VHEYELMTNHDHLVIDTLEPTLSRGMQWLNGTYVQWFNKTHDRVGHLFQGRFKGTLVEKETELLNVIRYVALNAVDAGMVERPEDDRWGSYRTHAATKPPPSGSPATSFSGTSLPIDGSRSSCIARSSPTASAKTTTSGREWSARSTSAASSGSQMRTRVESKPRCDERPRAQREIGRPQMPAIVAAVAKSFRLIWVRPAFRADLFGVTFPPELTPEGFAMRSMGAVENK
jgi:Transposase IS200 like